MEKLKLALLGCGNLSEVVATALKDGFLPEYELIAVLGRNATRADAFAKRHDCKACLDIDELMSMKPDFVAEAASVQTIQDYSERILNGGANLVMLSIGAFADEVFYKQIADTARRNQRRVYIANGDVGGFDVMRTASLMGPVTASIRWKQSTEHLRHTQLNDDGQLDTIKEGIVFNGTTKEAIAILPEHVNVAVATALVSAGPENTIMDIEAIADYQGDGYHIEVKGEEIQAELNLHLKTGKVAAWSVVKTLKNAVAPIVF